MDFFLKETLGEDKIPEEQTICKEVIAIVLNQDWVCPPGDIWQGVETFFVVTMS